MKRTFFLTLAVLVLLGAKTLGPTVPKPVSPLQSDAFQPRTKGPVLFRHQPHEAARVACTACHHDYAGGPGGRNVWRQGLAVQKCEDCHPAYPRPGRLDLKNAFHRQCKGCHLTLRQRGQRSGPIKCQDCHRTG